MAEEAVIRSAFDQDPDLCDRVISAARQHNDQLRLYLDISNYILNRGQQTSSNGTASKKRKLDEPEQAQPAASLPQGVQLTKLFEARDVSFFVPVRKKLSLQFCEPQAPYNTPGSQVLQVLGPADNAPLAAPLSLANIDQVFCLPVPEKAQKQHNFVVFPQSQNAEQYVWTVADTAPKGVEFAQGLEATEEDTFATSMSRVLDAKLRQLGKKVVTPNANEFASAIPESHRKGEKSYHVKAFRGSKDGYLFFTSVGIVWGFKKPLAFFAFDRIESISYTSVLQRTFNMVISTMSSDPSVPKEELEFAMIDQADFAGIDQYIKGHGLNDASMAAERQAKKLNVNGAKKGQADANGEADDGESELQKAEQELQDQEDEEEEDYDPSGGESEGEGEESEEDDGDGEGEEYAEEEADGEEYDEEEDVQEADGDEEGVPQRQGHVGW